MPNTHEGWNPLLKGYPESEKINACSIGAETLYTRLIARADDYANYYADPALLLAYLYGHRMAAKTVRLKDTARWRDELVSNGLVMRYEDEITGTSYIHVINAHRRLRNDVKYDVRFPREPANADDIGVFYPVTSVVRTRNENETLDPEADAGSYTNAEKKHVSDYSEDFETFWAFWLSLNRTENKLAAFDNWKTCLTGRDGKKPHPPVAVAELLTAAEHYAEHCRAEATEPKFVMHATTFLGPGQRWKDYAEEREYVHPDIAYANKIREEAGRDGSR